MSRGGFVAYLRIETIEICAGYLEQNPYSSAKMALSGDLGSFDLLGSKSGWGGYSFDKNSNNSVSLEIDFREQQYPEYDIPDECYEAGGEFFIGWMGHHSWEDGEHEYHEKAGSHTNININLPISTFASLQGMSSSLIRFDPIIKEETNRDPQSGLVAHVVRAYFDVSYDCGEEKD